MSLKLFRLSCQSYYNSNHIHCDNQPIQKKPPNLDQKACLLKPSVSILHGNNPFNEYIRSTKRQIRLFATFLEYFHLIFAILIVIDFFEIFSIVEKYKMLIFCLDCTQYNRYSHLNMRLNWIMYTHVLHNKLQLYIFIYIYWSSIDCAIRISFFHKTNISECNENIDYKAISTVTYLKYQLIWSTCICCHSGTIAQNWKKSNSDNVFNWCLSQWKLVESMLEQITKQTETISVGSKLTPFHEINYGGEAGGQVGRANSAFAHALIRMFLYICI